MGGERRAPGTDIGIQHKHKGDWVMNRWLFAQPLAAADSTQLNSTRLHLAKSIEPGHEYNYFQSICIINGRIS